YVNWKVDEHTWFITALNGSLYMYLLEGEEYALLIDTAYGFNNIREYAQKLTDKPVLAANTHGHIDHCGGNGWWERVYMHRDAGIDQGTLDPNLFDVSTLPHPDYERVFIREGDVISLGGRDIEVMETNAHAVSGLFFLDRSTGYLFTGDELESAQVLQLSYIEEALPLEERARRHLASMKKLKARENEITMICPAHNGAPIAKSYIDDYMELDELVMAGRQVVCDRLDHFYIEMRPDAAELRRTRHKKASFIYRQEIDWERR
ncbi:MAG: MBL fold metallo-hydrolase, partial [Clostridiales bacterium]|nr:MBL fold metallo-hydrolase [Clostridiales bacterium]